MTPEPAAVVPVVEGKACRVVAATCGRSTGSKVPDSVADRELCILRPVYRPLVPNLAVGERVDDSFADMGPSPTGWSTS